MNCRSPIECLGYVVYKFPATPLKINMEHNHGRFGSDDFPLQFPECIATNFGTFFNLQVDKVGPLLVLNGVITPINGLINE